MHLLKCIHSIVIDVDENEEQVVGILLGESPRVGEDGELIKCFLAYRALSLRLESRERSNH